MLLKKVQYCSRLSRCCVFQCIVALIHWWHHYVSRDFCIQCLALEAPIAPLHCSQACIFQMTHGKRSVSSLSLTLIGKALTAYMGASGFFTDSRCNSYKPNLGFKSYTLLFCCSYPYRYEYLQQVTSPTALEALHYSSRNHLQASCDPDVSIADAQSKEVSMWLLLGSNCSSKQRSMSSSC